MKKIKVTELFEKTLNTKEPVILHRGGARSSKSYTVIQYLIYRLTNEYNLKILITRKTLPALKITAQKTFLDLFKDYGYYKFCDYNKSDNILIYKPTNGFVLFSSLQDPERIKSSEFNIIFMEEVNEFSYNDYMILKTRLSAPVISDLGNKLIMAMNPVDAFSWVKTELVDKKNDVKEIVSNYLCNPFLPQSYIDMLLSIKDPYYIKVYVNGDWGVLENLIFDNWQEVDSLPSAEKTVYGVDFGYADPTAVLECRFTDTGIYMQELLYESGMTNSDLIKWMKDNINITTNIYCDSAEPQRIEEMWRAGINALEAIKGPDSIRKSIDTVKTQKLYVLSTSVNLIKELRSYKWAEDKNGNPKNRPAEGWDHLIAAMRYAVHTHLGRTINYQLITPGD